MPKPATGRIGFAEAWRLARERHRESGGDLRQHFLDVLRGDGE
ncbi:MAG: hypothetical protein AAF805_02960 [Planctomycetota bacterium]